MMFVLTLAISRAVPLLLLFSALLVVGRFLHDRYRSSGAPVARGIFIGVILLGMIGVTPYVLRSAALVGAETWVSLGDWQRVDRLFGLYQRLGGEPTERLNGDWAAALMNLERWREAEEVLLAGVERRGEHWVTTPNTIYLLGICRYYQGRWEAAEKTLRAVEDSEFFFLRDYYLGRLAERRGDREEALRLHRRALELKPDLFAALYQAVRLLQERGERTEAAGLVTEFSRAVGPGFENPLFDRLRRVVDGGEERLPPVEFGLVQFQS